MRSIKRFTIEETGDRISGNIVALLSARAVDGKVVVWAEIDDEAREREYGFIVAEDEDSLCGDEKFAKTVFSRFTYLATVGRTKVRHVYYIDMNEFYRLEAESLLGFAFSEEQ